MIRRRLRVLLLAEACNPEWVSVPLVGWSCSRALARVADTHLVTHIRNRPALIEAGLLEGADFTAIDSDRVAAPLHWLASKLRGGAGRGWTTVTAFRSLAYYYFERLVWKRFGSAIAQGRFDLVHRLTPLTPTAASPIAKHCARAGVPFVLGPLNGGLPWPGEFRESRKREGEWLSQFRGAHRWLPAYRSTRANARAILVGSMATWDQMPVVHRGKCIYVPENGIDVDRFAPPARRESCRPLRVAFIGRLVDYKNPDLVIEAIAPLLRDGIVELDVYGDGPLKERLKQLSAEAGAQSGVRLHGCLTHQELAHQLPQIDVLAFPSIREFGGAVVLEAMAMGVVPIVVDYGGPAELISDATGFRIPLTERNMIVSNLRRVIADIASNPAMLTPMREAGIERVSRWFTWEAKADQILQVYEWVTGGLVTKPDFGRPFVEERESVETSAPERVVSTWCMKSA